MRAVATGPRGAGGHLLPGVAAAWLPQPRAHCEAPVILGKDTTGSPTTLPTFPDFVSPDEFLLSLCFGVPVV